MQPEGVRVRDSEERRRWMVISQDNESVRACVFLYVWVFVCACYVCLCMCVHGRDGTKEGGERKEAFSLAFGHARLARFAEM